MATLSLAVALTDLPKRLPEFAASLKGVLYVTMVLPKQVANRKDLDYILKVFVENGVDIRLFTSCSLHVHSNINIALYNISLDDTKADYTLILDHLGKLDLQYLPKDLGDRAYGVNFSVYDKVTAKVALLSSTTPWVVQENGDLLYPGITEYSYSVLPGNCINFEYFNEYFH